MSPTAKAPCPPARHGRPDAVKPEARSPDAETTTALRLPLLGGVLALCASYRSQRFSRHVHEEYALGRIESGALGFRYRGAQVVAPAGSLSLAQPGVPHDGASAVPEGWRYHMLYLPPTALAQALPAGASLPHFRPGVIEDAALADLFGRVHGLLMTPQAPSLAKQTRLLALLAAWIARHGDDHPAAPPIGREPGAVGQTLAILAERFAEDVRLEELAAATGLSPWHLARAVTRHTGLPPHAHLLEYRCRAARDRLAGPESLADIALAVGFADQSHLTRVFRARFGLPPGAWRKIVQDKRCRPR
ncbi:AraC family transcriptional regulator [Solidesulfovibrio carbinolicus]|uniref:AraC family transcriptional regulator n=1 Tax=Solidesulfovibrio carbinolicus TaxID=296842 RepID=A0A4P6HL82_9BACT|nr:AraC family transcriptional regulator [Solidesulfovibrio carbinolicus]QAZ67735.1 AraC family transcriptional regulator [Solidesulfovibrio carbinolicus]